MKTDRPLTIGLVLDDSLDTPDGVQQYILTLGRWLSDQGHHVHYLVGQTTRTDLPNLHSLARNWKVRYNGNRMSIPLPTAKASLRKVLAELRFDILHVQTPYSPFMGGRLIRLSSKATAVVGTFHILPYDKVAVWANKLLALINHRSARRFDHVIANSQPSKQFADQIYGFDCDIIPNPFPLADFQVTAPKAGIPTIVFLGRLVERKGAKQLVQAVAQLRERKLYDTPFRVIIGGKGPLLAELQTFVQAHDLADTIEFSGFVAEADKAAFLAAADIAVFPSISGESFGISLLEALAASRGVVLGGDNPGYRSVLAPLNPAQLVMPTDTAVFAELLAQWLGDEPGRQAASKSQREYVKQFDIKVVGPRIVETYRQALRLRHNVR